eukprot:CAMPEP_0178922114 /NCGR_PEP_ID=MMETSP0786-20121207/15962_1 /TAXON_ID=186022 /ORGANISM="Thalassionema frauenfeldii, Strain CCMP 1798" /LENGTH=500 /DNA_ID=CAMNT_0020596419 /DNA_START=147 /DNA_END=1649 /DNA_ORIENTATION=+
MSDSTDQKAGAKSSLKWANLFLGELRDGLTMINMQSAFLMVSKNYTEKQVGVLFFVFGMSQFIFQTPSGYLMDYTDKKVMWLGVAGLATTLLTVSTALFAEEEGKNLGLMVLVKFFQGAVTSLIPPGLNSISQGIVGATGMTAQVSANEMMNHIGTATMVLSGSLIAYFLYPDIGILFIVSPIACFGLLFFLNQIKASDIDHNAARGLTLETKSDATSKEGYKPPSEKKEEEKIVTQPSFVFGFGASKSASASDNGLRADTPIQVLRDPTLLTFVLICFLFHTSNGTVLPLVMQSLALGNGKSGILMSGLCIIVAQVFMVMSAKICGTYSGTWGRKTLFLIGFFSVPLRCLILYFLMSLKGGEDDTASTWLQIVILSTQILDGVGAGTFGTMYVLVTSDISGGTGRFSLVLGLTTAAMSIGGTVSGYLGEALAQDLGYQEAFGILMFMSLIPATVYLLCMPETLPALSKKPELQSMQSIQEEQEKNVQMTPAGGQYVEMI